MLGKTHAAAGVATALLFSNSTGIVGVGLSAAFGCIGALLPDVDSKNSIANKKLDFVIKVTALASVAIAALLFIVHGRSMEVASANKINSSALVKVIAFISLLCISFIGSKTPHRSFTHSLEFTALTTLCVYFIYSKAALPFAIGILSHLALDLLNKKKLSLVWCLRIRAGFGLVPANGQTNAFCYYLFVLASIILAVWRLFL